MLKIQETIKTLLDSFKRDSLKITDGYSFNQYKTVNKIMLYLNNQYVSGQKDSKGNKKWFFPLHEHRANNVDKNIDIDVKNINIKSRKKGDQYRAWLAQSIMMQYFKEVNFSKKINEIVQSYSRWGNVYAKKTNDDEIFRRVDPRFLFVADQSVEFIEESRVIEKYVYTEADLRANASNWNQIKDIDEIVEKAVITNKPKNVDESTHTSNKNQEPYFEVYELYGEVPEDWIKENGDEKKYIPAQIIQIVGENESFTAHKSAWKGKKPYKELHYGAYKGRQWREGIIELLFNLQERFNEVNNQIASSMRLSKKVWSADEPDKLLSSLVTDVDDGDILDTGLQRVDTTEHNYQAQQAERDFINKMADDICNSQEILMGGNLPSNMPYRLGALSNQNANKLFEFLQEKLGIFLKEILTDWVSPEFNKRLKKAHTVKLIKDPEYLEFYYEYQSKQKLGEALRKLALNRQVPNSQNIEKIKQFIEQEVRKEKEPEIEVFEGMFDDFKYEFDIEITGEEVNKGAILETGSTILQLLQDPTVTQDPVKRGIINKLTEIAGFSPVEWGAVRPQPMQMEAPKKMPANARFEDNGESAKTALTL